MLPQSNRLRLRKDFEGMREAAVRIRHNEITLYCQPKNHKNIRVGFIVGKKVSTRAVKRNTVRRRLQEAVRRALPNLKSGYDILIIAKPHITERTSLDIEVCLTNLFRKAHLVKK